MSQPQTALKMSDHSDVSYISEEGDVFGQQQQQQQRGGGPAQQYGRGSRRPPRISHVSSLGSSAVGDDLLQDTAAATSWQVRLVTDRGMSRHGGCHGHTQTQHTHLALQQQHQQSRMSPSHPAPTHCQLVCFLLPFSSNPHMHTTGGRP